MMRNRTRPTRATPLGRSDWAQAALTAMRQGGLAGVVVETLAERLGTTKGSFYWYFRDREDLVVAALDLWEEQMTGPVVERLQAVSDPRARLRATFDLFAEDRQGGLMHAALLSHTDDPRVGPVLRRVVRRLHSFMTEAYLAAGLTEGRAHQQAMLATSLYLGHFGLQRVLPDDPEFSTEAAAYLDHVRDVLQSALPPATAG